MTPYLHPLHWETFVQQPLPLAMSKAWSWVAPYTFAILAVLLAGPLLSSLRVVQSLSFPSLGMSGFGLFRLIADLAALSLFWALAFTAFREIPDNGRGLTFLGGIVLPLATLLVIIFGNKALRTVGAPLVDLIGSTQFAWYYTGALSLAALWVTIAWIRHLGPLREAFLPPKKLSRKEKELVEPVEQTEPSEEVEVGSPEPKAKPSGTLGNGSAPGMLGRYKVLKELGRGAMGLVYLGKDPTIQRFVAIKTMRLDDITDDEKLQDVKARFYREAESAGRLSHPNIVTIYDAGEEDDLGYIAMELLEGTSLKQWSRKPNLMPVKDTLLTVATVAVALDYAHQQGVVHRDVKPANIMLTKERVIKVMDFGIAKTASSSKTQTNIVLGTPTYMSPEQIAGKKVDGRSDIFSLGVVLFELLTGQPPFTADNLSALLFAIGHQPHPPLISLRDDLPPMVQEVLDRALHKELPQRYRRAGEFAEDLRACLQSLAA